MHNIHDQRARAYLWTKLRFISLLQELSSAILPAGNLQPSALPCLTSLEANLSFHKCKDLLFQVSAKLKLVRLECVDSLIHNTLEHDNLVSLCFAPMLKNAWNLSLIREINASASATLRDLTVNFRYTALHFARIDKAFAEIPDNQGAQQAVRMPKCDLAHCIACLHN